MRIQVEYHPVYDEDVDVEEAFADRGPSATD